MDDKPALRPGLAVGESLRAVARNIVAEARTALDNPENSDAAAVHDFRRAMKRWRAYLRLVEPFIGEDGHGLRMEARDLARELGGARDAQSALDALSDLEKHGLALSARAVAGVRARIEDIRRNVEAATLEPAMRGRLRDALDHAEARIALWPLHVVTFTDIADQLARYYRRARQELPEAWPDASAEALHELRKDVVTHRYQMEIVEPLWPRHVRMWIGEAQRLRDRLGRHQDLLVLARMTGPHQPLARMRSRLMSAIAERQATHIAAARRIAARLFVDRPGAFRRRLNAMWETGS
jgi:CHAD domain-containing protein